MDYRTRTGIWSFILSNGWREEKRTEFFTEFAQPQLFYIVLCMIATKRAAANTKVLTHNHHTTLPVYASFPLVLTACARACVYVSCATKPLRSVQICCCLRKLHVSPLETNKHTHKKTHWTAKCKFALNLSPHAQIYKCTHHTHEQQSHLKWWLPDVWGGIHGWIERATMQCFRMLIELNKQNQRQTNRCRRKTLKKRHPKKVHTLNQPVSQLVS